MSSRSGAGPASGSYSSDGWKSSCTPRRPPTDSTWLTTSNSREMASPRPASPAAIARRASRNDSISSAMPSANSAVSASSARASPIDCSPPFEGSPQRDLVGVLEVATCRKSTRQTGQAQAHPGEHPGEVGRSGLPLEVRVGRQDDLRDGAVVEPAEQLLDAQLVRPDAFDRRDRTTEHVVAALELTGALDGHDV